MAMMSPTAAVNALDEVVALADASAPTYSVLRIYTGTMPDFVDDAATGTLLVEFQLSAFAAASDAGGSAESANSAAFPLTEPALATGTASYYRLVANGGAGAAVAQGSVGTSGADLDLNSTSFVTGVDVILDEFTLVMPE